MAIKFKVREQGSPRQKLAKLKPYFIESMKQVLTWWKSERFPRRFSESAYQEYRLPQRTKTYRKAKRRKYGHDRPLEYTGRMMREMKQSHRLAVRSHRKGKLVMTAPIYVNYKRTTKGGRVINKRDELTKLLKKEIRMMEKGYEKLMADRLNDDGGPVLTERIG